MAQDDFGNIDPNAVGGVDLANLLEAQRDADHSNHSGLARPSYVVPGMLWIKDGITPQEINFFDGTNDIPWALMDPVTHVIELVHKGNPLANVATSGDFNDLINAPAGGLTFISATDTTPNFLGLKIIEGDGVVFTINNPTAVENLQIDLDYASQAEAETGSDQIKPMNALRTLQAILANAPPPGIVEDFAGTSVPLGYVECDGTAINRTTFAVLFASIGTIWGIGDGSTTFNVPDLRRRTTIGRGGSGSGTIGNVVGNTGGAENVALSTAQLPSHVHSGSGTITGFGSVSTGGGGNTFFGSPAGNKTVTMTTPSAGSGQAHNNMQPSAVMLKVIKT